MPSVTPPQISAEQGFENIIAQPKKKGLATWAIIVISDCGNDVDFNRKFSPTADYPDKT